MEKRNITIKDIASKLNVSIATVSRALSGHPDISEKTKSLIIETSRSMGYHPNLMASGLIKRKSRTIGVIVPTINRQFWSNTISGIEKIAHEAGYKVMICQSNEQFEREKENIELLANSMVDGLLMAASKETTDFQHIQHVLDRGIHVLMFERVIEELPVSAVLTDDFQGAFQITEHLLNGGCRRIAHITGPGTLKVCHRRMEGYAAALKKHGVVFDETLVMESDFTHEAAREATRKLYDLPQPPDAIFGFADIMAIGVLLEVKEMGLRVPEDVAIAGFGNDDVSALVHPSLTTMSQPSFEIGRKSATLLIEELSGEGPSVKKLEVIKPQLIIRDSTKHS